jgi:hypothetical protein
VLSVVNVISNLTASVPFILVKTHVNSGSLLVLHEHSAGT